MSSYKEANCPLCGEWIAEHGQGLNHSCIPSQKKEGIWRVVNAEADLARLKSLNHELLNVLKTTRDAASMLCKIIVKHKLSEELDSKFDGFGKRADEVIEQAEKNS